MDIRKISIVGRGAMGIMYGQFFSQRMPEGSVRFIADEARVESYLRSPVTCNGKPCHFSYLPYSADAEPADLMIFAVKFKDLETVIHQIGNHIGKNTVILSLLNGLTSEDILSRAFGNDRVLLCTAQGMDAVKKGNHMTYSFLGTLSIGTCDGKSSDFFTALCSFFDSVGLPYDTPSDMKKRLWEKLVLNTGVNQAAAVFHTDYRGLKQNGRPREVMIEAMREAIAAGRAEGIELDDQLVPRWLALIDSLDRDGKPSLCQDLEAGRPTEVELFSGTIRRLGKAHGISTPANDFLYDNIKKMEQGGN